MNEPEERRRIVVSGDWELEISDISYDDDERRIIVRPLRNLATDEPDDPQTPPGC